MAGRGCRRSRVSGLASPNKMAPGAAIVPSVRKAASLPARTTGWPASAMLIMAPIPCTVTTAQHRGPVRSAAGLIVRFVAGFVGLVVLVGLIAFAIAALFGGRPP